MIRPRDGVVVLTTAFVIVAAGARARADELGMSPRAAVAEFLANEHAGKDDEGARYLDLGTRSPATGRRLARRLADILERLGPLDTEELSNDPAGDDEEGLPHDRELVGHFSIPGGASEPITLVRRVSASPSWVFSKNTVSHIDTWWTSLPARLLVEHLPARLLQTGPFALAYWQLIALPTGMLLSLIVGLGLGWLTSLLLRRLGKRLDPEAPARLARPLRWAWVLLVARVLASLLGLPPGPHAVAVHTLRIALWLVLFIAIAAVIDVFRAAITRAPWAASNPGSRSLATMGGRAMKLVVFVFAFVGALTELGLPVASLIAGLGVGGLGLALAAQKTVENLFGAFSLGFDQPFREGDTVTIEGVTGVVERIGLRSTRIRTAERSVVAIPNGKLAEMKTESLAARDRYRLQTTLSLTYGTSSATIRALIEKCEALLRAHPKAWSDVLVRLRALSVSSIDLDVSATFRADNADEFATIRQELLLGLLQLVEQSGSALAYPTQTVRVINPVP